MANAGQEQPFLFHGGTCEKIRLAGFPLGIFEEATYDERSFILDPGDMIVFHSDGIGDAQNPAREFFGHDRVCEIDRGKSRLSRRMESPTEFSRNRPLFRRGCTQRTTARLVVLKVK